MRYDIDCAECDNQGLSNSNFIINITPNNSGIYEIECKNGHTFKLQIRSHHFQVLFENAIHALSDKYFIESFNSFVASYERFTEFFIRIVSASHGIKEEEFNKSWKLMSSRSERQIGAFVITYLREFGEKPTMLETKMIELRNNVVHKGYFPSERDCKDFGDSILKFIRPVVEKLKSKASYQNELTGALRKYSQNDSTTPYHYTPYQIFAINRPINKTEENNISDFMNEQRNIKRVVVPK